MRSAVGCIGLGTLLLVVAGTFDAEPLYVTGSALVLLGGAAFAWIASGARGATFRRTTATRSVVEEEPLEAVVEVRAGVLPLPPGWIEEPLLPEPVHLPAGRRRRRLRVQVTFARRGRRTLAPPALVLRDPFGLAQRTITAPSDPENDEVTVLPRVSPVRAAAGGGDAAVALRSRASLTAAAETEIDGLRPHREGAPASRIHWAALARGHGLMERHLISEADSRPIVVVDLRGGARPEDADAAVRAAASLTVHFARQGGCALLLPGDRRAHLVERDLLAWPAAHVRLAVLGDALGPALHAAQNRRGLVVFVAARLVDRAPRALGRMPGGCLLVLPGELPGRRAVIEVAECRGYVAQRAGAAAAIAAVGGGAG
jgi:uncharacterized protein (DUF58 family)